MEDPDDSETNNKPSQCENHKGNVEKLWNPLESKSKQLNDKSKPAAHRVRWPVVFFLQNMPIEFTYAVATHVCI